MARTVTLLQLMTRARQLADVENDPNITPAELTDLANRHITEVYDALVDAGPPDYYAASTTVSTVAGTISYTLPADFRSLVELYAQESSTELRPVFPIGTGERGRYRSPTGTYSITIEYIPAPTLLTTDLDTFDGVSGWDELIANLMARDVMVKREQDPSIVLASIAALQARIASRARNRDRGHPRFMPDTDAMARTTWPWGWSNNNRIQAYRLRAGNIELYESLWGLP